MIVDGNLDLDGQPEGALVEHVDKMLLNTAIITFSIPGKSSIEIARQNTIYIKILKTLEWPSINIHT